MSIKASKREIKESFYVVGVPYCDLQYLLRFITPFAHSEGVYGWQCDYYQVDGSNFVISTGYSTAQNIEIEDSIKRDIIKKYNNLAAKENGINCISQLEGLLTFFKKEIMENRKK